MEGPLKKKSFVPKMFRVFTVYIFATLAVFFGYIQIFGGVKNIAGSLPTNGADGEIDTTFSDFVTNIMSLENISLEDVTLEFSSSDKKTNISMVADVAFDTSTSQLFVDADLIYNDMVYDISVNYTKPDVYLTIEESTYKFCTETENGTLDLTGLLGFISQNLNIDTSGFEEIQETIGIDFSNFEMSDLISQLDIATRKTDNGSIISINLMNIIQATINCDVNANIQSAKLEDIKIKGNVLKFNAPKVELNSENISEKFETPDATDVIDMSAVTDYLIYSQNLLGNDFIEGDLQVDVDGKTYDAKILIDNSNGLKAKVESVIEGIEISVVYADETVYLSIEQLGLSFKVSDYEVWKDKIEAIVERETSQTISEFVDSLIDEVMSEIDSTFSDEASIFNLISKIFSSSESINAILPDSTVESESEFAMIWDEGVVVTLKNQDKVLSEIDAVYQDYKINLKFKLAQAGFVVEGEYYDLSNLLPIVDVVDSIVLAGQFGGEIEIQYQENALKIDYVVDFSDGIIAKFETEAFGENVSIFVQDKNIFVQIGGVVAKGNLDNIEEYLSRVNEIFGTKIETSGKAPNFEKNEIVDAIKEVLNILSLTNSEDNLLVAEYLSHMVGLSVDGATATISYNYKDYKVNMTISATEQEITIPTATDDASEILNKIESIKNVVESKKYAMEVVFAYKEETISGRLSIDLENNVFALENLTYKNLSMNVYYKDKTVFVEFADVRLKFKVDTILEIVSIVEPILKANGIEFSQGQDETISNLFVEIFGEDISNLSIMELLEKVELEIEGSLDELSIGINLNTTKILGLDANIKFDGNDLKSIEFENGVGNIELVDFAEITIDDTSFYDLTSTQKGQILISVGGFDFTADVELDLNGRVYAKVSTTVLGLDVQVIVLDNMAYVTIGELKISGNLNEIKEIYENVAQIFEKAEDTISENSNMQSEDEKAKLNEIFDTISKLDLSGLKITTTAEQFKGTFAKNNAEIELILNANAEIEESALPSDCEYVQDILPKIEYLYDYISNGNFEFDFDLDYNGLDFAGTLKYSNGIVEIANVLVAGEYANIRIENDVVYFSYGNMKLKFDIPENDGSVESESLKSAIEKITSDTLGVEIKFGVFEEVLDMLTSYTMDDYIEKIVLTLSGNSNDLNLTLSNKNESLSQILTANVKFKDDKLDTANLSIYKILTVDIKNFNLSGQSTIEPFDEEDYKDYSTDFVAGMLDSLEVVPEVYAFSSDIAIRYSKTNFYGELVAMMYKDETAEFSIGGYVPALSIHTTSLGLNSYIYLIGQTVYIDINGLQVYADLNETTIDEIMTFVEDLLGTSVEEQAEVVEATTEVFRVILPAIDKIYGSWISEIEQGVQIEIKDILQYGEESYFDDIIMQIFISEYNEIIVPTKLVIGANIYDPNTTTYDDYSKYWLVDGVTESGDKVILEDVITKNLNFGAYFTNISVGKFAEGVDDVFAITNGNYKNIQSVMSNYGTTALADFNSYETVLTLVDTIYNYGTSLQYQVGLSAEISDAEKGTVETSVDGDVIVEVREPLKGETCDFDLFDGKIFEVQGNFDINSSGTRHLFDLLYSNGAQGLYFSYSHGEKIGNAAFRGNIKNTNMSEIISMIVGFTGIELSDDMKEAWNIGECTTDFTFVQSLLGMGDDEETDDSSKADIALDSVESITKMLGLISLDTSADESGLVTTTLSVQVKLNEKVEPATVSLILKEEQNGENIVTRLRQISIQDLNYGGKLIDVTIDIQDFNRENFDYDTTLEHHDLSSLPEFIDVAVNTINDLDNGGEIKYSGNAKVNLIFEMSVGVNVTLRLDETDSLEVIVELMPEAKWIFPLFVGTYVVTGAEGHQYTTIGKYDSRVSTITFAKDENGEYKLNIVQNTDGQIMSAEYSTSEISANIIPIIALALGLNDATVNLIDFAMGILSPDISLEETLTYFKRVTDGNNNLTGYALGIKGEDLTGSSLLDDFDLNVGVGMRENKLKLTNISTVLKILAGIGTVDLSLSMT